MNKFINKTKRGNVAIIEICFSIWIVSVIINAISVILLIGLIPNVGAMITGLLFIALLSAGFSLPGIILFSVVFFLCRENENLFKMLMITAVLTSLFTILAFFIWIDEGFARQRFWLVCFAMLSALLSVLMHRRVIKKKDKSYV